MAQAQDDDSAESIPPGGRRAARKARTRQAILSAASHVFAERGYGSAALEEIARQAEVSIGSIYAHFPEGKQALFIAALTLHTQDDLREAQEAISSEEGPQSQRLAALLGRIADSRTQALLDAEAWLYAMRHDDELSAALRAHYRRSQAAAVQVVRDQWTDTPRAFDDEELGLLAVSVINGLFRQRVVSPEAVPTTLFTRALHVLATAAPTADEA